MMRPRLAGLALVLATTSTAIAASPTSPEVTASGSYPVFSAGEGELVTARQWVPEQANEQALAATTRQAASPLAQSRTIYLNRNGAALQPAASNDARLNRSTIVAKNVTVPAWKASDAMWNDTVQCMRDIFAPFAVKLVTEDPGNVPHLEAIFGGSSSLIGLDPNYGGISPFTSSCSTIENSIVFAFTDNLPSNARTVCEVMAQEIAHSYGLDHVLLASDPMTYLPYKGNRWFQDQTAACGEKTARPCGIGNTACRANQNSVGLLRERLGIADPENPTGSLMTPAEGDLVGSDFDIRVDANDNVAVTSVEFFVDDVSVGSAAAAPYAWTAENIPAGTHTVTAVVTDQARNTTRTSTVTITVEPAASGGCSATGGPAGASIAWVLVGLALLLRRRG